MKTYTGLNIQYPISLLILDGTKIIETRTYPIPDRLLEKEIAIIETPGKNGGFKSRIVGIIIFSSCFKYKSKKEFYNDFSSHQVSEDSPWAWKDKAKWAWVIKKVIKFKTPKVLKKRPGIIYTNCIEID